MEQTRKYLIINIKNIEPIKIGTNGVRNQVETSKTYIPGSTIKGAIISKLIHTSKINSDLICEKNSKINKKEILTNLYFYNAYPYIQTKGDNYNKEYTEKVCIKAPISLRTDKQEYRKAKNSKNMLFGKFINLQDNNMKKQDGSYIKNYINNIPLNFIRLDNSKITNYIVEKELRFHHRKTNNKVGENDNIFRYEAIKKNHQFLGIIMGGSEAIDIIKNTLDEDDKFYIGGSKGSGYGLCTIKTHKIVFNYEEVKRDIHINYENNKNDKLQLYCLSDCILRNEEGNPINYILPRELNEIVGDRLIDAKKDVGIIADISYSQGYNVKWGLRYPKEPCVKAGSVMEYSCTRNVTDKDIKKIDSQLYGVRITDGYGWIMANIKIPNKIDIEEHKIIRDNNAGENKEKEIDIINKLKDDKTYQLMIKNLNHARNMWLILIVSKEKAFIKNNLSNSMKENIKKNLYNLYCNKDDFKIQKISNFQLKIMKNPDKFSIHNTNIFELFSQFDNNQRIEELNIKLNTKKGKLLYNNDYKKLLYEFILKALDIRGGDKIE